MELEPRGRVVFVICVIKGFTVLCVFTLEIRLLVFRDIDSVVEFSALRVVIVLWNRIA
jgi:hypothetical protein